MGEVAVVDRLWQRVVTEDGDYPKMPSLSGEENPCTGNIVSRENNYPCDKSNKNGELGGWNSIQSLSNSNNSDHVYVHPLDKRSSSAMSTKSLEMCTESLGSETGSNINGDMDEFTSLLSMERQNPSEIRRLKTREISKKISKNNSFPPPLTSISGSNGVQVSTHREGGRLVIKAVNSSSSIILFQTERKNGRLRLSLPKQDCRHFDKQMVDENEEEEENDNNDDEEVNAYETENEFYNNNNGGDEGEADFNGGFWGENGGKIGCKIGSAEWCSSSRCKGDSKRLPSLHFCVAIS
ncbi:Protein FANTASTIC FOUR 1 [Abeliophyllum distichum]|uniref:Protein FANTASTIC FOUR 1 n=1 Tax=Abeliophyllum distichum TaxID=126358 RepID=A0ABD1TD69_9LAMI